MGGTPERFVGRNVTDLFDQGSAELYLSRIAEAASSNTLREYEDHITLPSGITWFLSIYTRVLDPSGNMW